ncbi:MAG: hypothetical protein HY092_03300 [Candidatus Kerfeldbacteria bacterium]|nr:hypothetical protein [Candidatus Kerfeldbacteria bacterium]
MANQLSEALMARVKTTLSAKLMESHAHNFHDIGRTFDDFFPAILPDLEQLFLEGVAIGRLHQRVEGKH